MSTAESEYDDGYNDDIHGDSEFNVKIYNDRVTLKPNGIFAIAIECYTTAYAHKAKHSIYYFRVESNAMEFAQILQLHAKKNIQAK
jgi:hypothetical protein